MLRVTSFILAVAAFVGLAAGSSQPVSEVEPLPLEKRGLATIYSACKGSKQIAWTFDDGPYIYDTTILNTLKKYSGVKVTFFLNTNNWECAYDDARIAGVRALYAAGHEFGSHTNHHYNLSTLSWDHIHDEMYQTELYLSRVLGVQPAMMRPPYGSYNNLVREAAYIRNQSLILWDFDSKDSLGATAAQSEASYKALITKAVKNVLPLNHSVYNSTVSTVFPYVLDLFTKNGYKFVTVSECLGIKPYQWTTKQGTKNSTWKCT